MTDDWDDIDRKIGAFMSRVAVAHGQNDPAPDPSLIWLRARLEQQREREQRASNAGLVSFKLIVLAVAISAIVSFRFTAPVLAESGAIATTTGVTLAGVGLLIWFLGIRPLLNAR